MAGDIRNGILDAPKFSGDTASNFRTLEGFLSELCRQLRYVLANLSGDNFNETEFTAYISDIFSAKSIATESLYAEYGVIAGLTVARLRTDYLRAARYRARNTAPLDYIDIRDNRISFYHAVTDGSAADLRTDDGKKIYYTDAAQTAMTTTETAYPVRVYVYTPTLVCNLSSETAARGTQLSILNGNGDGIRLSDGELAFQVGETALSLRADGIHGLPEKREIVMCGKDSFDADFAAADIGTFLLKPL